MSRSLLVIGVGSIGERHLRCFQATGKFAISLCEVNSELREAVAGRYGVQRAYADLDVALAGHYDAAVIATPAHLHVPIALKLARKGVHLFIEKPLSTSLDGVDDLVAAVRSQQLTVAVGYTQRAFPALQAMKEALDSGRFGRPVQLVAVCGQHFPKYRPAYRTIYFANRATGGGAIQDFLTHLINTGEWLVGPIDRLAADAAHQVLDGVEVEDTVNVIARHGRVLGSYSLNQHQAPNEVTITVICDRGTARAELHLNRWRWMIEPDEPWHDEPGGPLERDAFYIRQAAAFLDTLDGKRPPLCTLEEALQTLRVNLAILEAVESMSWQAIHHDH